MKLFHSNQHTYNLAERLNRFVIKWIKRITLVTLLAWALVGALKIGQHLFPQTVYAEKEVQVPVETSIPVLDRIIQCESGGQQYGKDGQILVNINVQQDGTKSIDVGVGQVNVTAWGSLATKLGYDLTKEKDNKAFTKYLFLNKGSEPWYSSKKCWNK